MLSFSLVAEALAGLIYHRPLGENFSFLKKYKIEIEMDKKEKCKLYGICLF